MSVREARSSVVVFLFILVTACGDGRQAPSAEFATRSDALQSRPTLTPQISGTANRLDAVSVVNEHVAWASGRNGTVVRTIDGGATWEVHVIPGAETLAFRDIDAFSKDVAFVLSNNNTPNARIYKTEDGGQTWKEQQSNTKNALFDVAVTSPISLIRSVPPAKRASVPACTPR